MIQRQFHEPLERDVPATRFNFALNLTTQLGVTVHGTTIAELCPLMKAKEHLQAGLILVGSL
jgi:hypothetical protein